MAAPPGNGTLPPARPSTSQASSSSSTVRCYIFRGQKLELLKRGKFPKAESKPECTPTSSSLSFMYSARSPAACVPMSSATNTAQATPLCGRNTLSYHHFLKRKIKLTTAKVDSVHQELENAIKLLLCKIDTYTDNLNRRMEAMRYRSTVQGLEVDFEKGLKWVNTKKDLYAEVLKRKIELLEAKKASNDRDITRQIDLLNSKLAPFAQQLGMEMKVLNSKNVSYTHDLGIRIQELKSHYFIYVDAFGEELTEFEI